MSAAIFWIVVLVGIGIAIAAAIIKSRKDNEARVVAVFGDLRLTPTELIEGYSPDAPRHRVAELVARVEDSGTVNRRLTATRMVALGVFALAAPKKQDDRSVYLTIEGPTTAIVRTIEFAKNPTAGDVARRFAAAVNLHARRGQLPAQQALAPNPHPPALRPRPLPMPDLTPQQAEIRWAQAGPSARPVEAPRPVADAGWYPDDHGAIRWFDGYEWTPTVRPRPPALDSASLRTEAIETVRRPLSEA